MVGELLPSYGDQEDPEAERSPVQGERDIHCDENRSTDAGD